MFSAKSDIGGEQIRDITEDKGKLRKIRSALFKTKGGVLGEELGEGDVSKRDTFFGN